MLQIATGTTYKPNDSHVAGSGCFVSLYVLVIGAWTVQLYIGLLNKVKKEMLIGLSDRKQEHNITIAPIPLMTAENAIKL